MGPKRARVTPSTRNTTSSCGGGVRTRGGGSVSPSARATRASKGKAVAGSSQDPPPPSDSNVLRAFAIMPERFADVAKSQRRTDRKINWLTGVTWANHTMLSALCTHFQLDVQVDDLPVIVDSFDEESEAAASSADGDSDEADPDGDSN
ncbi:hypothetical protein FRX31_016207 [Thalictrum thalictroides]|uniref:Uncharacterized protein n=1 Tax=Thalictrum thalictroides TaxID=46969 RepID=A0A7J6W9U5_THATH|nr:hypothetical protein FRX31_016207 [Thalictrum thalictroides]